MKRIGIFGGSFNPPHLAHLIGAEISREALRLDTVLFMPASIPPHKQRTEMLDAQVRLRMVEAAIQGNPHFEVSAIELEREGPSYSIDTLKSLRELYPDSTLVLIVGMDNLEIFHQWRSSEEILAIAELAVMVRPGYEKAKVKPELLARVTFVEIPLLAISGTEIRERVSAGQSIKYMVTEPVIEIIEAEKLYRQ